MKSPKNKPVRKIRKKRIILNPCLNYPAWSLPKYQNFIRSAMRQAWRKWPPRYDALKLARRKYIGSNKKQKWEFQCAVCQHWFMGKNVCVDHIEPWGSLVGLSHEEAWSRLLVSVTALQVLCRECHTRKTHTESN